MELHQLQIFNTAAKMLNFTKAGKYLGYTQTNVTGQIKQLENELGVRLFERIGRNVQLTHQGQLLLKDSQKILLLCKKTEGRFKIDVMQGILNIGAAETACVYRLPPILSEFHQKFPNVELHIQTESCEHFFDLLKNNIVDIAFVLTGKIQSDELIVNSFSSEQMSVVVGPSHPFAKKHNILLNDLKNECLIITMPGCGYRPSILAMLSEKHIQPASFMELSSIAAIKECTSCGLGIAILPKVSVADYIRQKRLIELHVCDASLHISTQIIYNRGKWISPVIDTFLQFCDKFKP